MDVDNEISLMNVDNEISLMNVDNEISLMNVDNEISRRIASRVLSPSPECSTGCITTATRFLWLFCCNLLCCVVRLAVTVVAMLSRRV